MRFLMYVADLSAVQSYTFSLEKCPNIQLKICKNIINGTFYRHFETLIKQIVTLQYLFLLNSEINLCYLRCWVIKHGLQFNQCHFALTILTSLLKDCPSKVFLRLWQEIFLHLTLYLSLMSFNSTLIRWVEKTYFFLLMKQCWDIAGQSRPL